MKKKLNIKEIARIANVSPATVSLVTNNRKGVSDETRKKILRIIDTLGYTPSSAARFLVSGKSNSIGVIVPDMSEVYCGTLARTITDYFANIGYITLICNSNYKANDEVTCYRYLSEKGVEGAIILPSSEKIFLSDKKLDFPLVCVDSYIKGLELDYIGIKNFDVSYQAVSHLIGLGRERIACIWAGGDLTCIDERIKGYKKALSDNNIEFKSYYLRHSNERIEGGWKAAEELFALKDTPDAVYVTGDVCAIGVCEYLLSIGKRIPEDVAIIGFDDIPFAQYYKVPLTTVRQPVAQMAEKAVDLLHRRIDGDKTPKKHILLEPEFIIRDSCGSQYKK